MTPRTKEKRILEIKQALNLFMAYQEQAIEIRGTEGLEWAIRKTIEEAPLIWDLITAAETIREMTK